MTVTAATSEEDQFKQMVNKHPTSRGPADPIPLSLQYEYQISRDTPVIIDFWASPWCGPCRAIGPVCEKFSQDPSTSAIEFYSVDRQ